jgi:hypothetical protein
VQKHLITSITYRAMSVAAVIALLGGCSASGTSPISQTAASHQRGAYPGMPSRGGFLNLMPDRRNHKNNTHHFGSFNACPATGPIRYASDDTNNVINIYAGKFAGQAPCGQIAWASLNFPYGLYVKTDTHDLYVANGNDILVFQRGATTPYNIYVDPTNQVPNDVTIAKDGTIIVNNLGQFGGPGGGSISTWIAGPHGGTFVGNFPTTNAFQGGFITIQKNGTIYFNDQDATTLHGVLWSVKCPAGACGVQTQIAGVSFGEPGGLGSDSAEDLLATDSEPGAADTFELPNPNPKTFPITGIVFGMAINQSDDHWFVADALHNDAAEYAYPSGNLIGTVPGNPGGNLVGIALDPGHAR